MRVLLAFGFIHIDKGLGDLLEAMRILRINQQADLENVRLVIAGAVRPRRGLFRVFELRDRIHLRHLMTVIRRTGLHRHVVLTGYVPDGEVGSWFDIAEAVVLPYRRIEQSGVAGLARSLGVPVLASTAGGLAEQCAGSRWTFPPQAPARMARAIADFLHCDDHVNDAPAVLTADLKCVTESTLQLYGSVIDQSRPGSRCDLA
jgi:glycosyltransferase involved in cell wall biosynthesis